jgi:GWxTD domain-containing protein
MAGWMSRAETHSREEAGLILQVIVLASALVAYEGWDESPEAYFLTEADRREWAAISNDSEAAAFVETYFQRRGPCFERELRRRIAYADAHFSTVKTHGAMTLSGRIIIVLGPPTYLRIEDARYESEGPSPLRIFSNVLPFSISLPRTAPVRRYRTFIYWLTTGQRFQFEISYDPADGTEQLVSSQQMKSLEAVLRQATEAAVNRNQ